MKDTYSLLRKCSPVLAAGAGAAVCLTSHAAVVSGNMTASNADTSFGHQDHMRLFNSKVTWALSSWGGPIALYAGIGLPKFNADGEFGYIQTHSAGVIVSSGMTFGFESKVLAPRSISDKYYALRFTDGGYRFGWIHIVSTGSSGGPMFIDTWGYENTGATIKTLAESVTAKKLELADGQAGLRWTNANEQGVARYAVEVRGDDGAWTEVDGDAPGSGTYGVKVEGEGTYRLAVERIDGTTDHIDF